MKPALFDYHAPTSLEDALALLATHGDAAQPLAGGQSLVPMMNLRAARPAHVVDLSGLSGLGDIRDNGDSVAIGALVRHADIERSDLLARICPILPAVAHSIGHYAIRQRGTIGGSLAHADPAAQWPLMAVLFDAMITVVGSDGARQVPAGAFFQGIFTTALELGELVTGIELPTLTAGEGWGYRAFSRRHGDFAIVAAATTVALDTGGRVTRLRLALGGIGDVPVGLSELAAGQTGRVADADWMRDLGKRVADMIEPQHDLQASAIFRRELAELMVAGAVADALERRAA